MGSPIVPQACRHCGAVLDPRRKKYCTKRCFDIGRKIPLAVRFWAKVRKSEGCWEWTSATDWDGYGKITSDTQSNVSLRAHRVSWEMHFGPIEDGLRVLHTCDNPPCVRPDHLFLGTDGDNTRDAAAKGRMARGERNAAAKLTPEQVSEIRSRYASGSIGQVTLAAEYSVGQTTISEIVLRKSWGHIR